MNKLDLRKTVVILLFIIAAFGLSFFSELISFEALKENRSDISDFRDENFILSILVFWLFYFLLVVFRYLEQQLPLSRVGFYLVST